MPCRRALDVGCGYGLLARKLARRCDEVVAIDLDAAVLARTKAAGGSDGIAFVEGDVMTYPFADGSFDLITAVASLHHLPLSVALGRFRALLKPGGVLAVIGLYHMETFQDYAYAAVALPMIWTLRFAHAISREELAIQDPKETLKQIRAVSRALLPGSILRQHLLSRYSLVWQKPRGS